ncbi:hypothetical protein EF847_01645 [Actinobacteria bacterium YIM 96077]|uniref:Holin n=1 Tax=Phytoactinopolyspora halophila TaxID=1981511 RepID=A0A329QHF9_9ACTN|nr:hypothetical protein EF847_01645 [Actinobacteria bacterium YIM 96077]RAW11169.1 hypothetical protein DPM12_17670 [Phytoactinopolyspora halophila]
MRDFVKRIRHELGTLVGGLSTAGLLGVFEAAVMDVTNEVAAGVVAVGAAIASRLSPENVETDFLKLDRG